MIETKPPPDVERQFQWLTSAIKRVGNEAPLRVATHLRTATNGRHYLLPNYHSDPLISNDDKSALYKLVFSALVAQKGKPDWSRLEGQSGNGIKRVDPIDAPALVAPRSERLEPPVAPPAVAPRAVQPAAAKHDKSDGNSERELADALVKVLGGRVNGAMDADAVEAIADKCARSVVTEALLDADKEFEGKLKKYLGNGSFPTERIQQLIETALANTARQVVLVTPAGETKPIKGLVHKQFDIILKMTSSRVASGHPSPSAPATPRAPSSAAWRPATSGPAWPTSRSKTAACSALTRLQRATPACWSASTRSSPIKPTVFRMESWSESIRTSMLLPLTTRAATAMSRA
jgi:hypothetical protein